MFLGKQLSSEAKLEYIARGDKNSLSNGRKIGAKNN